MSKRPPRKSAASEPVPMKYILPVAGIIVLRLVAALMPGSALWGLDFIRYMDTPLMVGITAVSLLVALDRLGKLQKLVEGMANFLFPSSIGRRVLIFTALSLAFMAAFVTFTVPYPFLGDGKHVVTTLFRILKGDTAAQAPLWNEPLTHLYYLFAFKTFSPETLTRGDVYLKGFNEIFKWTSYVIGGLYVFSVMWLSGYAVRKATERLALVAGILGSGGLLLYFGYLEYYAFLYFFGTLFILVALGEIKSGKSPVWSGILLALAIAFHLSGVVFIPAYVFLLTGRKRQGGETPAVGSTKVMKIVAGVLALCAALYVGLNIMGVEGFFIPMLPGEMPWALLSVQHGLDILNNVFVHAPFAAAVLVAWLMARQKDAGASRELQFTAIAAVFWFALIVAHSAIARDWDVYALFGVSFVAMAFYLVSRISQAVVRRYYYRQMALQPLLLLIPWIAVNSGSLTAMQKAMDFTHHYEDILPLDVTAGCYETLREFNADIKNPEGEIIMLQKILELKPNPYDYYKLSRAVSKEKQHNEMELAVMDASMNNIIAMSESERRKPVGESGHAATMTLNDVYLYLMIARARSTTANPQEWLEASAERLAAAGSNNFRMGLSVGNAFGAWNDHQKAMRWYMRALADTANADREGQYTVPKLLSAASMPFMLSGQRERALQLLRIAAQHPDTDAQVVSNYGFACYVMKLYEEAEAAFRRVLKVEPTDPYALCYLGKICIVRPETREEGRRLLTTFLRMNPKSKEVPSVQEMLASPPDGLSSLQP